ncbi:MAG: thiol:disulfide interchange protein DsbA/DsbL [Gammaproteobacteria bacterium]
MSRKQREARLARIRYAIMGGVAVVIVVVAGYGFLYSAGVAQGEFVEGEHYRVLDTPLERRRPGAPILVQEYFSYGCIHCKNFDPILAKWVANMPDGVSFERVPVAFSSDWAFLARTYLALAALDILDQNHTRIFRHIHDNRMMFASAEDVAAFVDGHGATADEFLEAFNGPEVRRKLREAETAQRQVGIDSVPTLVVDGRYVVAMDAGRTTALDVVDHLIAKETAPEAGEPG